MPHIQQLLPHPTCSPKWAATQSLDTSLPGITHGPCRLPPCPQHPSGGAEKGASQPQHLYPSLGLKFPPWAPCSLESPHSKAAVEKILGLAEHMVQQT
jgi:hypothetical protein